MLEAGFIQPDSRGVEVVVLVVVGVEVEVVAVEVVVGDVPNKVQTD